MTIVLRPSASLFHAEGGWFSANWHFSFDQYWDEANMGIGDLRVFNDDRLVPGAAWPMHPHRDIEGITYVAEGTFEHADSRGNGGILHPGAMQRATLGSGMEHSERNGSKTEPMRFIRRQTDCFAERRGQHERGIGRRPPGLIQGCPACFRLRFGTRCSDPHFPQHLASNTVIFA